MRKGKKSFHSRPQTDPEVPVLHAFFILYLRLRQLSCPLPCKDFWVQVGIFCDFPTKAKAAGGSQGAFVRVKKRPSFLQADWAPEREDG